MKKLLLSIIVIIFSNGYAQSNRVWTSKAKSENIVVAVVLLPLHGRLS